MYKGGESANDSYRPISLLPVLSKILEQNIETQVRKHLEINNIFFALQNEFRQKYSTETALGELVGYLAETFDKSTKPLPSLLP